MHNLCEGPHVIWQGERFEESMEEETRRLRAWRLASTKGCKDCGEPIPLEFARCSACDYTFHYPQ